VCVPAAPHADLNDVALTNEVCDVFACVTEIPIRIKSPFASDFGSLTAVLRIKNEETWMEGSLFSHPTSPRMPYTATQLTLFH